MSQEVPMVTKISVTDESDSRDGTKIRVHPLKATAAGAAVISALALAPHANPGNRGADVPVPTGVGHSTYNSHTYKKAMEAEGFRGSITETEPRTLTYVVKRGDAAGADHIIQKMNVTDDYKQMQRASADLQTAYPIIPKQGSELAVPTTNLDPIAVANYEAEQIAQQNSAGH